jgi:putative tricarboxylic transport membrane protein
MRLNDALLGLILLVFAGALGFVARGFPAVPGQDYGASAFPTLIAAGFAGCGLALIASGLRARAPLVIWQDWVRSRIGRINVLAIVAAVVFYVAAADVLGFVLTAGLILLVLLRLFGVGWGLTAAVSIVTPLAMQYLFGSLLLVPLPWGLLAPVRWW